MRRFRAISQCLSLVLACFAGTACNLNNEGESPPQADIKFPSALLLSAQDAQSAPRFLYLVSANFDLRYNRGAVQVYDLAKVNAAADACVQNPAQDCPPIESNGDVFVDEVLVHSLATSVAISPDRRRMYVATRSNPTITFIDLDENGEGDGVLSCDDSDRHCSNSRDRGQEDDNLRDDTLPIEPVGMLALTGSSVVQSSCQSTSAAASAAAPPGTFVMLAHRGGEVSLFYDAGQGPELVHVLEDLTPEPTGIAYDECSQRAFLSLSDRENPVQSRRLARVGVSVHQTVDAAHPYAASYLYEGGDVEFESVAAQRDTTTLLVVPGQAAAANRAALAPQLIVASQNPATLLFADAASADGVAATAVIQPTATVPVGEQPVRLALGEIGGRSIVAVSSYGGQSIYIVDRQTYEVLGAIHSVSGPYDLAIDSARERMYVADFRTSNVHIIDLSTLAAGASPRIVATLGVPQVIQELQ
jgi:DNA-binding beta-propeller fold protein YncE